jgi:hypothetical protein
MEKHLWKVSLPFLWLNVLFCFGQTPVKLQFNQAYEQLKIDKNVPYVATFSLQKDSLYQFLVLQQGIDVMLTLLDKTGKQILEKDSPNGRFGFEIFEFSPSKTETHTLRIQKFEEETNADQGVVSLYVKKFSKTELQMRKKTSEALAVENNKTVLTLDIEHFWEAFDHLQSCRTTWDSIMTIQNWYLDRATNGLLDFIAARNFSADAFVAALRKYPKYYRSIRPYTYETKKAEPIIQEVFQEFKGIYSNFKPFQVCFAIGVHRTGGTVSNRFVLLGTEMITTGRKVDYSELGEGWAPSDTTKEPDLAQGIKGIVTHECVHTQQPAQLDSNAIVCNQLYSSLREGAANFIGEFLSGTTNYSSTNEYGDKHERELWNEFKSTLCWPNGSKWLYNGDTVKDHPADLGYYIGYKICQAYYQRASNKRQAIVDIIEIRDPLVFLQQSRYDQKKKN